MPKRSIFVIGTRAQLIKVAPVVVACERRGIPCVLLMTGQHKETMDDLIEEFGVEARRVDATTPAEHATVVSLARWLPQAYTNVKGRLRELAPTAAEAVVLVHGDTLSTFVGALAAKRCRMDVVHLESGLTSGALLDPFPEEFLRRLVFRMTDIAMCPNDAAEAYMRRLGVRRVVHTGGNSIVDAVALSGALTDCGSTDPPYVLASLHRFQNIYHKGRLRQIVEIIERLSQRFTIHFVLHPATRDRLQQEGLLDRLEQHERIVLHPRMGYGAFLRLAAQASCVLTDGGSNQEELAVLGVPTVVMRTRTERPDGLGRNAVLEGDLPEGVASFILGGGYERLRTLPVCPGAEGPSEKIAGALLRLCSLEGDSPEAVTGGFLH